MESGWIFKFKKINGKIYCFCGGLFICLATPKEKQPRIILHEYYAFCQEVFEVKDFELIRLWPHRTTTKYRGEYNTEDKLKSELEARGYRLNSESKWVK